MVTIEAFIASLISAVSTSHRTFVTHKRFKVFIGSSGTFRNTGVISHEKSWIAFYTYRFSPYTSAICTFVLRTSSAFFCLMIRYESSRAFMNTSKGVTLRIRLVLESIFRTLFTGQVAPAIASVTP